MAPASTRRWLTAVVAVATALAACGGDDDTAGDAPATTAVAATIDSASAPSTSADEAASPLRLATVPGWDWLVEPLLAAEGAPVVELDFEWQDTHADADAEQQIIAAVASGELDLGYVGARAFDTLGVTAFAPLTAPLLIESHPVQQAVLDSDIPERMLASLDELDVTGVAIGPGPLRRPLGVDGPLLSPDDFAGITMQTWRSQVNESTANALGATHTDVFGDARNEGLLDGTIQATENSLDWALNNPYAKYVTANVVLWPAIGVLVANPSVAEQLGEEGLEALRARVAGFIPPDDLAAADEADIAALCDDGFRFADATDADLAALRQALEPVYSEIGQDEATAAFLAEIETLKGNVSAAPLTIPSGCTGEVDDVASEVAEGADDPSILNGVYQLEWTVEELMAAIPALDEDGARGNAGVFTLTMTDGRFDQTWSTPPASCPGTYAVTGNRVTMVASDDVSEWDCGGDSLGATIVDATFTVDANQLVLADFELSEQENVTWFTAAFLGKPLARVG